MEDAQSITCNSNWFPGVLFLIPVFIIILITILVIGREIIKTILISPVKTLRAE
jgi:hypothetical protein